jgi:hypothetical protein
MEDEIIQDIKSKDITQLQIPCDDLVQMKTKTIQGSGYLVADSQGARNPAESEERGDRGDHRRPHAGGGCGDGAGPPAMEATTTALALGLGRRWDRAAGYGGDHHGPRTGGGGGGGDGPPARRRPRAARARCVRDLGVRRR